MSLRLCVPFSFKRGRDFFLRRRVFFVGGRDFSFTEHEETKKRRNKHRAEELRVFVSSCSVNICPKLFFDDYLVRFLRRFGEEEGALKRPAHNRHTLVQWRFSATSSSPPLLSNHSKISWYGFMVRKDAKTQSFLTLCAVLCVFASLRTIIICPKLFFDDH